MLNECKICLGEHNDEIHEATQNVRGWFHFQVTKWLEDEPVLPVFDAQGDLEAVAAA
jgi:hypothetical protein